MCALLNFRVFIGSVIVLCIPFFPFLNRQVYCGFPYLVLILHIGCIVGGRDAEPEDSYVCIFGPDLDNEMTDFKSDFDITMR